MDWKNTIIVFLACRRITFEWMMRRHVIDGGLVEFRDGIVVTSRGRRARSGSGSAARRSRIGRRQLTLGRTRSE